MILYKKCMRHVKNEKGVVMIITLLLMVIMTMIGVGILNRSTMQIRAVASVRKAMTSSLSAESGVFGVTGWMLFHRRADVPSEIRIKTDLYETDFFVLDSGAVVELPGYSAKWRGMVTRMDSHSPNKTNAVSTIEAVSFIPVAPAGYGNEPR